MLVVINFYFRDRNIEFSFYFSWNYTLAFITDFKNKLNSHLLSFPTLAGLVAFQIQRGCMLKRRAVQEGKKATQPDS